MECPLGRKGWFVDERPRDCGTDAPVAKPEQKELDDANPDTVMLEGVFP